MIMAWPWETEVTAAASSRWDLEKFTAISLVLSTFSSREEFLHHSTDSCSAGL